MNRDIPWRKSRPHARSIDDLAKLRSPNHLRGKERERRDRDLEALARDAYAAFGWQRWRTETQNLAYGWPKTNRLSSFVEMVADVASVSLPAGRATDIASAAERQLLAVRIANNDHGVVRDDDARSAFAEAWLESIGDVEGAASAIRALGCGPDGMAGWLGFTYDQLAQRQKLAARRVGTTTVGLRERSHALARRTLADAARALEASTRPAPGKRRRA